MHEKLISLIVKGLRRGSLGHELTNNSLQYAKGPQEIGISQMNLEVFVIHDARKISGSLSSCGKGYVYKGFVLNSFPLLVNYLISSLTGRLCYALSKDILKILKWCIYKFDKNKKLVLCI